MVMKIIKKVLGTVLFPIKPIIEPIIQLCNAFLAVVELIIKLLMMIPRIVEIFFYLLNIPGMLKDIIYGLTTGATMVLMAFFDILFGDIKKAMIGSPPDKESNSANGVSAETDNITLHSQLVKIIILVLCPPLAIMLKYGITGISLVFITGLLTYFYYIPGLVYACLYLL
jgi:uncharacterized membrane protein YqaE (UPF0057 family)